MIEISKIIKLLGRISCDEEIHKFKTLVNNY